MIGPLFHSRYRRGKKRANFKTNQFLQGIQSFSYCLYSNFSFSISKNKSISQFSSHLASQPNQKLNKLLHENTLKAKSLKKANQNKKQYQEINDLTRKPKLSFKNLSLFWYFMSQKRNFQMNEFEMGGITNFCPFIFHIFSLVENKYHSEIIIHSIFYHPNRS